jgi:hypothetical protein
VNENTGPYGAGSKGEGAKDKTRNNRCQSLWERLCLEMNHAIRYHHSRYRIYPNISNDTEKQKASEEKLEREKLQQIGGLEDQKLNTRAPGKMVKGID